MSADCFLRHASDKVIVADVDIYSIAGNTLECQLEGLTCTSFTTQGPEQDRKLFSRTVWRKDISSGLEMNKMISASHDDNKLYEVLERTSYYYLRQLRDSISMQDLENENMAWHYKSSLGWILERLLPCIEQGQHPRVKPLESGESTFWLHVADPFVAKIAYEVASDHGVGMFWTAPRSIPQQTKGHDEIGSRVIHPFITERELYRQVPSHVGCLLTLEDEPMAGFYQRLTTCVDGTAGVYHLANHANSQGYLNISPSFEHVRQVLEGLAKSSHVDCSTGTAAKLIDELLTSRATAPHSSGPLDIVDWQGGKQVTVVTKPLDTSNLFSHDKTYFLVGLSGELGLGLCNWMIDNGA